ncbi:MAG: efflux transporter outer membrane subunit [Steroidobacteraceae bacterium]
MRTTLVCLVISGLISGCAVGPAYVAPPAGTQSQDWLAADADTRAVEESWWRGFDDPVLTRLIETATDGNLDLRVARARLTEARAARDQVAGATHPQWQASAAATKNRLSENGQLPIDRIPGFARDFDLFDAGFDASWEIDLWGRDRRMTDAAVARTEAAAESVRDAIVSLRAEIARTYVELRVAQTRLETLSADADSQGRIAILTQQRLDAGEASRFDADRARGLARATAAQIPALRGDVAAAAWRLALLAGKSPEDADASWQQSAAIPQAPDLIAMGVRSDLLRRRPDIRAAERELAAAAADVGVAAADLFPRVSLLGSIGQQSRNGSDLTDGGSTRFTVGPQIHWALFDRGRLRASVRAADARSEAAAARYEATVLGALAEVETSANRFARSGEALSLAREALAAQSMALGHARERQSAGESDLIELLTVESAYASVQQATTQAEAAHALQAIALYKALGGGAAGS